MLAILSSLIEDSKSSMSRGFKRTLFAPHCSKCSTSVERPVKVSKYILDDVSKQMM